MTPIQIKYMVDRFLGWKLPENFRPDSGISFTPEHSAEWNAKHGRPPARHEPCGTNLFDATQAEAMVRYMIDGMPTGSIQEARIILLAHGYTVKPPQDEGRLVPHHGSGPGNPTDGPSGR